MGRRACDAREKQSAPIQARERRSAVENDNPYNPTHTTTHRIQRKHPANTRPPFMQTRNDRTPQQILESLHRECYAHHTKTDGREVRDGQQRLTTEKSENPSQHARRGRANNGERRRTRLAHTTHAPLTEALAHTRRQAWSRHGDLSDPRPCRSWARGAFFS